ncbi:transporter substrate-binding domain-containing protein [Ensifer sp. 4252]|uniref:transporter substrate-binding domain-containing protein n=1 Tax=Ensifer sp. 4252 TaxID=3373915 RepID=UPI003D1B9C2E
MIRLASHATLLGTILLSAGLAHAEVPAFATDGDIGVCTTAAFPPLTFKESPADARPTGIDIEIAEALAGLWNAKVNYTVTEFAGLLPTLGAGRCDVIISGIYINAKRRETYDGVSYMKSATAMVTKAGSDTIKVPEDLSGKVIALEAGAYYKEERIEPLNKALAAKGQPPVEVQEYPTQQAAYQQVLVGRVDATMTEEAEGAYRASRSDGALQLPYTWASDFTYGIYSRREGSDAAQVKAGLKALKEQGFFGGIAKKYGLDPALFDVDYDR